MMADLLYDVLRWFGLILLPVVSFAADGVVAIAYFAHSLLNHVLGRKALEPQELAKARAIDLSIQLTLFWMPFLVLLGWWINKPMHLLFGECHAYPPMSTQQQLKSNSFVQIISNWR